MNFTNVYYSEKQGKCCIFTASVSSWKDVRMADDGDKDRITPGRRLCVNSFPLLETFLLTFSDIELQSCGNMFTDS